VENGRGTIANGILASGAGIKLGDQINLLTPTGEQKYTVAGIASDYLNAKTTTAYISQANIAADFGRMEDIFYQINLKSRADETAVDAAFQEIVKPYPQFKLAAGLIFGALAAVSPARQAARMDVVTALRYEKCNFPAPDAYFHPQPSMPPRIFVCGFIVELGHLSYSDRIYGNTLVR